MQCDNAKMVEVRDKGAFIGHNIICTIKKNRIIGGYRSAAFGMDLPTCYQFCEKRVLNGIFINKE